MSMSVEATEAPTARFARDHLKSYVERIERINEERKALADDLSDVYQEAKSNGFDTKALKAVIRLRAQDPADIKEHEAILDSYLAALGMLD